MQQLLPPLPRAARFASGPAPFDALERFLAKSDVRRVTSLSDATIQRMVNAGDFPPPVPLSHNRVGWIASEIAAWQQERIRARSASFAEAAA